MAFGVEPTGAGNFDDVTTPQPLGAVELNERAAAAKALPLFERQLLDPLHADPAVNRHAFVLHEVVVRRIGPVPATDTGVLTFVGFLPLGWIRSFLRPQ